MSRSERIGQLFMIGSPANELDQYTLGLVGRGQAGSVILTGRSFRGVAATAIDARRLQAAARAGGGPGLFVATDQEGGQVQVLNGPGFDTIPSARQQGNVPPGPLTSDAARWGRQLRAAGVNLDLGPVLDTVPGAQFAPHNPPIGAFDREFGFDPDTVARHGGAVIAGLSAAGVLATAKHFPGLGRVRANTDTNSGVVDRETTADDPFLGPFRTAIADRVPFVMMSTAIYTRIDASSPAAFSSRVVDDLLRRRLGFDGVVISDDLGHAAQVQAYSVGRRAVDVIAAGGDMVLTVDAQQVPAMRAAVRARMDADPAFARQVTAAVERVLRAKISHGLA